MSSRCATKAESQKTSGDCLPSIAIPPTFSSIPDTTRKHMVAEFDERLRDTSARLTEADIEREIEAAKSWAYSF